ncbi:MAG: PQQ-like beta-propeller repeat protein [Zavarzinella sp.]|nr:PQQ-like beta-propeller repeat protein [Zavarzinella sp.]
MRRSSLPLLLALLVWAPGADAKITTKVTLEQVKDQQIIFTAKVTEFYPDKPGMILVPIDKLKGEFPFDRVPVNLTGDDEAIKEKQPALILDRLDKGVLLVVFASRRGGTFTNVVAYTNGTWLRLSGTVEKSGDREATRWQFLHCEPYFRRTFKGSTEDLVKAMQAGLKGQPLPAYDEKEEPGFGPPLKKTKDAGKEPPAGRERKPGGKRRTNRPLAGSGTTPFGVIQIPFLGLIAALAALFPAVFGGMALLMRRWVAALSVASFVSILAALVLYFPHWVGWTGLRSLSGIWLTSSVLAGLGALWAAARYRRAVRDGREDEYQPRYLDRVGLAVLVLAAGAAVAFAALRGRSFRESPWLELTIFLAPALACLYFTVIHRLRTGAEPRPVAMSTETVGLWAGSFACAVAGAALMTGPRGPAVVAGNGTAGVKLEEQPAWVFEPKEKGEVVSTPCVTPGRVYLTVHHRQGFDQYGRVYALDTETGTTIWEFDDEGNLKPLFSSPVFADGKLYFGEGYHTDHNSKLYCLDAATGKKLWAFQTTSHTESTPAVSDGKVVFGAGDDGIYCLDAATGQKVWQYPPDAGLHVDSNPFIHGGRVYAGSGTSQRNQNTRIVCLDLMTGAEAWVEKVEYSAWGSPVADGKQVFFATGNGTFSEDRNPIAGLVLCRDTESGRPLWERPLPNSLVGRPAVDRFQVYVGCKDGNVYALDRHTGEVIWSKTLQSPVLAAPAIDAHPDVRTGEVLYAIGTAGVLEALSPANGAVHWTVSFPDLIEVSHVRAVSTPVVVRQTEEGKTTRRIYVGLGFGPSANATPTARLYCFRDTSE